MCSEDRLPQGDVTNFPDVAHEIGIERRRQVRLMKAGKIPHACEDPQTEDAYRLGVLIEEVGEVGKAVHEEEGDEALYIELVQVAAVASAWAEGIYRELKKTAPKREVNL